MTNLTPPELGLLALCAVFVGASIVRIVSGAIREDWPLLRARLYRLMFPLAGAFSELAQARPSMPPRWRRPREIPVIRPEEHAEQLVDALARGTLRIQATILAGDVPVSCRWVVDLSATRYGSWLVHVGPYTGHPTDLCGVYEYTRDTLQAIVEQRRVRWRA